MAKQSTRRDKWLKYKRSEACRYVPED